MNLLEQAGYVDFIEETENSARVYFKIDRDDLYQIHDISPEAERVVRTMLRTYTGMFSDYVYVNEDRIASEASLPSQVVYESLISLAKADIISFIPKRRVPFVHFPTAREEKRYVEIGPNIYENRREVMERRVEAMIDYGYNDADCRVARMLKYFGEADAQPCGTCERKPDIIRSFRTQDIKYS